jgi:hypothetical protein
MLGENAYPLPSRPVFTAVNPRSAMRTPSPLGPASTSVYGSPCAWSPGRDTPCPRVEDVHPITGAADEARVVGQVVVLEH